MYSDSVAGKRTASDTSYPRTVLQRIVVFVDPCHWIWTNLQMDRTHFKLHQDRALVMDSQAAQLEDLEAAQPFAITSLAGLVTVISLICNRNKTGSSCRNDDGEKQRLETKHIFRWYHAVQSMFGASPSILLQILSDGS